MVGMIFGNSLFIALNSVDFCNNYIFSEPHDTPLLTLEGFFYIFGWSLVLCSVWVTLFVSEAASEEEEIELGVMQTAMIFKDLVSNPHFRTLYGFFIMQRGCHSIFMRVSSVYLTNDLKFP